MREIGTTEWRDADGIMGHVDGTKVRSVAVRARDKGMVGDMGYGGPGMRTHGYWCCLRVYYIGRHRSWSIARWYYCCRGPEDWTKCLCVT